METNAFKEFLKTRNLQIYHQTNHTLLAWIPEDGIAYNYHKGFVTGENYREHGLKVLELLKKYKARKLFTNVGDIQVVPLAEQQWTAEVLIPQVIATGVKVSAYIIPASLFGQVSVDRLSNAMIEATKGEYVSVPFADEMEAYQWLQAQ